MLTNKKAYVVRKFDVWFSNNSQELYGVFDNREDAVERMKKGFEAEEDREIYFEQNGISQWFVKDVENEDTLFAVDIAETYMNFFSDM